MCVNSDHPDLPIIVHDSGSEDEGEDGTVRAPIVVHDSGSEDEREEEKTVFPVISPVDALKLRRSRNGKIESHLHTYLSFELLPRG